MYKQSFIKSLWLNYSPVFWYENPKNPMGKIGNMFQMMQSHKPLEVKGKK